MDSLNLVPVTKYSKKIKKLNFIKRIAIDYPLLCRDTVAFKLNKVAEQLPNDLFLQIDSAYRTKKTEQILWNARKDIIPGLVNNPNEGRSSHNTGGAIDVSLLDSAGKEINLSEPFLKYYQEPQLHSDKITEKAQELRLLLNKCMLNQGFVAHPKEYWHFSYGDARWAEIVNAKQLYFEIEISKDQYYSFLKILVLKLFKKLYRLMTRFFKIEDNI